MSIKAMQYDVVVIGGGPAGLMAAGRAGELGARVLLLEKGQQLGAKLLITGKGRCNITNLLSDLRELVLKYGKNGKFLFSALNVFGPKSMVDFLEERGVMTKIEKDNRVFPVSDSSVEVRNALAFYLDQGRVEVRTGVEVKRFFEKDKKIEKIILGNGEEIFAKNFIFATGGKSYPLIGSTGDGYKWAEKLGHTITPLLPSLTPVVTNEDVKSMEGISLREVCVVLKKDNKKIAAESGDAVFTADGLSGPVIHNLSKLIGQEIKHNQLRLEIDFFPKEDFMTLDKRVQNEFSLAKNKQYKTWLGSLLEARLVTVIGQLSGIKPDKKVSEINKDERKKLVHLLKEFGFAVKAVVGFDKAIITAGGVLLSEVDPKTMRSKIISNLFFAGEILDLDGPTGGYNLQVCWSTGFVAGGAAAK